MKNKNIPAFPIADPFIAMKPQTEEEAKQLQSGMTLRDYFAAAFVKSGTVFPTSFPVNTPDRVAAQAYELADAMLKARNN
jgi:hypothetical protein